MSVTRPSSSPKRLKAAALFFVAGLALAACTTATPYQAANKKGEGFSEFQLEQNKYRIVFSGNTQTSITTVENYLLYRAAEVTLDKGGNYFIVSDEEVNTMRIFRTSGTTFGGSRFGFRRGFGGGFASTTATTRERQEFTVSAIITIHKGKKPSDVPEAFEARQVIAGLGSTIIRPEPKS